MIKYKKARITKKKVPSVCNECGNVLRYEARFNARLATDAATRGLAHSK